MRTTGPWQGCNTWIDLKPWPFASDNLTTSTCSRGKRNYEQQQQCGIEHPVVSETWSLWWFAPNWQDEVPAPEMRIDHGVSGGSLSPMWERRGDQTRQDRHWWSALPVLQRRLRPGKLSARVPLSGIPAAGETANRGHGPEWQRHS